MADEIHNTDAGGGQKKAGSGKKRRRARRRRKIFREIVSWVWVIIFALVIALLIDSFVVANAVVPTGSMESTVPAGSRIMGFRLAYTFSDPERGDIVIFKFPDDESVDYLKRIIGLPGETVEIIDGKVYIDGVLLKEDYLDGTAVGDYGPYEVPEGCYFMLGDNRNVSADSRSWDNTYVKREAIIARAVFMYYPQIKLLTN